MKSTLVSASILAIAALASANSFAEGRDPYPLDQVSAASTKTRAEVRAELLQAQREGYNLNQDNTYADVKVAPVSNKTRAEVRAELLQAQREGYNVNLGNTYPDVKVAPVNNKTRAEVKAETTASSPVSVYSIERDYPTVQ